MQNGWMVWGRVTDYYEPSHRSTPGTCFDSSICSYTKSSPVRYFVGQLPREAEISDEGTIVHAEKWIRR